jgi:hypothetical protein
MPRGLVALSASAVAAIYVAGYARTQSADASIDDIATAVATSAPTTVATVQPSTAIAPTQRSTLGRQAQAPADRPSALEHGAARPNGAPADYRPTTSTAPAASNRQRPRRSDLL